MPWKRWKFPKPWGLPQLIYGKSMKILCLDDLVALVTQKHPYGEFIEFMKNSNFPEMV
jgi:hypothetical protein